MPCHVRIELSMIQVQTAETQDGADANIMEVNKSLVGEKLLDSVHMPPELESITTGHHCK